MKEIRKGKETLKEKNHEQNMRIRKERRRQKKTKEGQKTRNLRHDTSCKRRRSHEAGQRDVYL